MALYNFQKRFVPMILSGEKHHTIRAKRSRETKPGELLHLYTGLRQKGAQLLMRTRCTKVQQIDIVEAFRPYILIDGVMLSLDECKQLAKCDGFSNFAEMILFWEGRMPFTGDIIHWHFPPEPQSTREIESCANVSDPDASSSSGIFSASARRNVVEP